jgi:mercuric ion transport protein
MKGYGIGVRIGRVGFLLLSMFFAAAVLAQVFIAGAATFVNPVNWGKHVEFVHYFGFLVPLLMFIFALIGRMPRRHLIGVLGVMLTIFLMYFTANITRTLPWAGAFHPMIAVVIAAQAVVLVKNAWSLMTKKKNEE